MAHAIVRIGYAKYVLPIDKAVVVAQALTDAEQYQSVYISREARADDTATHTHHIWSEMQPTEGMTLELISDDMYRLAKLAGKPAK